MITALVIFIITYIFIGLRQIPRVHIDRPAGALVGAVLMIVFGVLSLDQAFAAIDMHTLLLLLGMMIITVYLRHAGFFELMADKILSLSKTPLQLLVLITLSSGLLSALFVNDTICLLYTPIVLEVALQLGVSPMPYLLALATASNIGSVMTVTGNPQNMLIGIYSGIPYLSFLAALLPVTLAGMAVSVIVIRSVYRAELKARAFGARPEMPAYSVNKPLLLKSLLVCAGVLVAFSIGYPYSLVAAAGGVLLLLAGGVRTERILEGVDWTLLLFFAGLFVVMHGVEASGLAARFIGRMGGFTASSALGKITGLSTVSLVLSNLVSNVPAVMLLKPLTQSLGGGKLFWLALAMSSTLAGNFTLIGSVANLIVAQQARRRIEIGFMEYFRVGAIITIITIGIGILVLAVEVRVAQGTEALRNADPGLRLAGTRFEMQSKEQLQAGAFPMIAKSEIRNSKSETGTPRYSRVTVESGGRIKSMFRVVLICDTVESRAKGLQGFRPLKQNEAALFVFQKPQAVTFWMGSVRFPIDIVFIAPDGTVSNISADCRPGSADYYYSAGPVSRVIETAAGSGIKAGDRIEID